MPNNSMVRILGTRRNFSIIARHKGLVVCRLGRFRSGRPQNRTCLALVATRSRIN